MLYSRALFLIHSVFNSLHLLIPNSQSSLPLGNHKSVLYETIMLNGEEPVVPGLTLAADEHRAAHGQGRRRFRCTLSRCVAADGPQVTLFSLAFALEES